MESDYSGQDSTQIALLFKTTSYSGDDPCLWQRLSEAGRWSGWRPTVPTTFSPCSFPPATFQVEIEHVAEDVSVGLPAIGPSAPKKHRALEWSLASWLAGFVLK